MTPTSSVRLLRSRRLRHRGGAAGCPAVWSLWCRPGPFHHRSETGGGPDPGQLRPRPSLTRFPPCRPRRTGCDVGGRFASSKAGRDSGSRPSPGGTGGDSGPVSPPASRRGPGLHPWDRQGQPRSGSKVRASRWYEHQEALEVRRLGDAPLDPTGSPTPSTPSPGRRHELPRGVDLRFCPAPASHRQAGGRSEV